MELYEENYARLRRLVPGLERLRGRAVSHVQGTPSLYLETVAQARYTTTLHLTYYFEVGDGRIADPDLHIRACHDARVVEVVACGRSGHRPLPPPARYGAPVLDCKWESNVFLEKWLSYMLDQGHCFGRYGGALLATGDEEPDTVPV